MKTTTQWIGLASVVVLALSAIPAFADPVLIFNSAAGGSGLNQNQSVGWQFDVLTPLVVTGLGWFDEGQNGLGHEHTVGIWSPTGALLASLLVPAGTTAGLDGQFRTVSTTPFVLPVGSGYIVGGENFDSSGDRLAAGVSQVVDPRIGYVDATFSNLNSGFTRPTSLSIAFTGFYGPSFSVIPAVPEPSTIALLGAGVAALVIVRRRL